MAFIHASRQLIDDPIHVIHTSTPGSAARFLQGRPEARGGGKVWIGCQIISKYARFKLRGIHQINRTFQCFSIQMNPYDIPIPKLPDRPARQRFRTDVADARPAAHAAESTIGQQRCVFQCLGVFQRDRDLRRLRHSRTDRAAAEHDHDLAGHDRVRPRGFHRVNRGLLVDKDAGGSDVFVYVVFPETRIDGRAFDDRSVRREVAAGKNQRAAERAVRRNDQAI